MSKKTLFKKALSLVLSLCLILTILPVTPLSVFAEEIDITEDFTDLDFRKAVYNLIGKTEPAPIYKADVCGIEELYVDEYYYMLKIETLNGIEHFTALKQLRYYGEYLTEMDISKNTALNFLQLCGTQLTKLDVSQNTALTSIDLMDIYTLTEVDVSGSTSLKSFQYEYSSIEKVDVSGCTSLTALGCRYSPLYELNISGCTALKTIHCFDNLLTELDVSGLTDLTLISCPNNRLTRLDLSGCTALTYLWCSANKMTELDVSGCSRLDILRCDDNCLTELNLNGCSELYSLYCQNNYLTSLDISQNTRLRDLQCQENFMISQSAITGNIVNLYEFTFYPQNSYAACILEASKVSRVNSGFAGLFNLSALTLNLANGLPLTLGNINSVPGLSVDTAAVSGSRTNVTINTTANTPAGKHPVTLSAGGVTSDVFYITVVPYADLDGDGLSGLTDIVMTAKHLLNPLYLDASQQTLADVDKNGAVNARDLVELKKAMLGFYD